MEIQYQPNDNLVLDATINVDYNMQSPTTLVTVAENSLFDISYNDSYPKFGDIEIFDTTGTVNVTGIIPNRLMTISTGTITKLRIPFINDKIKEISGTYLADSDKYILKECELFMTSTKAKTFDQANRLVYNKIFNTDDLNIIDYILDPDDDFEKTSQLYIQGNMWGTVQRDNYVSPRQEQEPLYIFECKDSTGTTYSKLYLKELPQSYGVISDYYEFIHTDLTSYDTTDMVSIKTLPMLIKSPIFKRYCNEILSDYTEVNVIMYINNIETDVQFQYDITLSESKFIWKQKGCCIFVLDLEIDKFQIIKDNYKDSVINISLMGNSFVRYQDRNLKNLKCFINNNELEFNRSNIYENYIDFNSKNYFNLNSNITVFDFEYADSTVLSIKFVLINALNNAKFNMSDLGLTISRRQKTYKLLKLVYSDTAEIFFKARLEKYYITELPYNIITQKVVDCDLITTKVFFQEETKLTGVLEDDVKYALDLIKQVNIDVLYRNINKLDTLFYINFKYDQTIQYLKRFLSNDIIQNILNNMLISVNCINDSGVIVKQLISLNFDNIITKYIDDYETTYIVKHSSLNQIININGIFNKKKIDALKISTDTTTLPDSYIPSDIIIVNNTQKTN